MRALGSGTCTSSMPRGAGPSTRSARGRPRDGQHAGVSSRVRLPASPTLRVDRPEATWRAVSRMRRAGRGARRFKIARVRSCDGRTAHCGVEAFRCSGVRRGLLEARHRDAASDCCRWDGLGTRLRSRSSGSPRPGIGSSRFRRDHNGLAAKTASQGGRRGLRGAVPRMGRMSSGHVPHLPAARRVRLTWALRRDADADEDGRPVPRVRNASARVRAAKYLSGQPPWPRYDVGATVGPCTAAMTSAMCVSNRARVRPGSPLPAERRRQRVRASYDMPRARGTGTAVVVA